MDILKFGGGVLKSAKEIMMLPNLLEKYRQKYVIIISAIGKTTNAFEKLLDNYFINKHILDINILDNIKKNHYKIISDLDVDNIDELYLKIDEVFNLILNVFNEKLSDNYSKAYDRIIPFGEILASTIVHKYLQSKGFNLEFLDVRDLIKTDSCYRDARIDWNKTQSNITSEILTSKSKTFVTQGFIASDSYGNTTTLGREGSDFSASIFAYCLNAKKVIFWKEVDGIYNADPTKTNEFELLPRLSYREAVEQAYYGAKILHPKTIKPLQNKNIDVEVRSFYKTELEGTSILDISEFSNDFFPNTPIYIVKENQILISFLTSDFSFIVEDNLANIFSKLSNYGIKVNLMQNSALSFSVCVDNIPEKVLPFIEEMKKYFDIKYNDNLHLITIRHYTSQSIERMTGNSKIILRQKSRHTARYVIKPLL